ncbi:MAG: glyoxalase/bleomycin resistance/dioxygenase family protein, partial [Coleofasciculus sp.]
CCYAIQDKVWVSDPDGNRWEIFVVKLGDTAPEKNICTTDVKTTTESNVVKPCCA